jgi:sec-independent protein translocase protein TatA
LPGFAELVLILIVVLVIFGAGKLPAIATAIGKTIVSLRQKTSDPEETSNQKAGEGPEETSPGKQE